MACPLQMTLYINEYTGPPDNPPGDIMHVTRARCLGSVKFHILVVDAQIPSTEETQ
jgi:hypothetical protein